MEKELLKIVNLKTSFNNGGIEKVVHKNLNLKIYEGEVLSIIGENGVGKTVLAETIVGIRPIQNGELIFTEGFNNKIHSSIQLQSEDNVSDLITPRNIILFYKKLYKYRVDEKQISEMITKFGVEEFLDRKTNVLSGGQKQRLNLLLAMINKPRLLILDEFTTGLDITSVIGILNYILEYVKNNNVTLVVITHSAKEIKLLADRVVCIKDGIISSEYGTSEIDEKWNGDFDQFLIDQITQTTIGSKD